MKDSFLIYRNLCCEIEIIEIKLETLEKERDFWWFKGKGFWLVPLDNAASRVDKINDQINEYETILKSKIESKKRIENQLKELKGIEYKVAYMRYVESMTLQDIADELGYSLVWVKKISSRLKEYTFSIPTP